MTITWPMTAAILGGIVLAGNAGAILYRWIKPIMSKSKEIDELSERMEAVEQHQADDLEALHEVKDMLITSNKMILAILNHSIDGNVIEDMMKIRDKVIDNITTTDNLR